VPTHASSSGTVSKDPGVPVAKANPARRGGSVSGWRAAAARAKSIRAVADAR
jgi:hypothetical protein